MLKRGLLLSWMRKEIPLIVSAWTTLVEVNKAIFFMMIESDKEFARSASKLAAGVLAMLPSNLRRWCLALIALALLGVLTMLSTSCGGCVQAHTHTQHTQTPN
jgi:hypothetical protein